MSQKDPILGKKIHEHLLNLGIETPMIENKLSDDEKIDNIKHHFKHIMETLGLDLNDDSLAETPKRVAKMYVNEFFTGLDYNNFPKCTTVENKMASKDEFVCVKDIKIVSMCEHHFLEFSGLKPGYGGATLAYFPKDKVLGISKLNRIISEYFCKRPQIQERLTVQVAEAMKIILECDDVAVYINSRHSCSSIRGVKDTSSSTVTCSLHGRFLTDSDIRKEFLELAKS